MLRLVGALVVVAVAAAACGPAGVARRASGRGGVGQSQPVGSPTEIRDPGRDLKVLARADHARLVVGPVRSGAGLFAADSVVPSVYCCRDPHARLRILRWNGDTWVTDGKLTAIRDGKYWNFPDYSLYSADVRGADAEAPLFGGAVNGAYPTAHMLAVRVSGRWRWATFVGCSMGTTCRPSQQRSSVVLNPHYSGRRLTSFASNCEPSCAASTVTYRTSWRWSADTSAFVVAGSRQLNR